MSRRKATLSARPAPAPQPHASQPLREAVLYARVSSKDQEREGFSIPAQEGLLRTYATEHGLAIVEEFVDVETAKKAGRTGFDRMLGYLKTRKTCRVVLVEKTDRLYRNLKDWVTLDGMGDLEIHLVKEGTILSDDSRSSEKFIHGIKVLMAKNYIDNLSEETRKGMLEKARQGIWPSRAPLGYKNVQRPDGKRVIELDPMMAPLIHKIFELYDTGNYSLKALTAQAKKEGLAFRKSQVALPRSSVWIMLKNPLYIGEFDWDGVRYQGTHPPIVSKALFDRVQDRLEGRATTCRHERKLEFAFSGVIRCAHCAREGEARILIGSIARKRYTYYHCERCKELGRAKYTREEVIDKEITRSFDRLRLDDAVMAWLKRALRESMFTEKRDHLAAIERLKAEYDRIQQRIDAAYEDRLDGRIDAEFFDRRAREWREQQARVRRDLAAHETADQQFMELGVALLELGQRAGQLYELQDATEKRRLLEFVYSNSSWDGERLTITWRKPFDVLADSPKGSPGDVGQGSGSEARFAKWLPLLDLN